MPPDPPLDPLLPPLPLDPPLLDPPLDPLLLPLDPPLLEPPLDPLLLPLEPPPLELPLDPLPLPVPLDPLLDPPDDEPADGCPLPPVPSTLVSLGGAALHAPSATASDTNAQFATRDPISDFFIGNSQIGIRRRNGPTRL